MTHSKFLRIIAFVLVTAMMLSILTVAFAKYDTIPYGEQSDQVRKMQKALRSKGFYKGSVDGKFGPSTKAAVRKYQASIGLHSDGKPGNKTLTALYEGVSKVNKTSNTELKNSLNIQNPRSLYYGCTGSRVRSLQSALKSAGYYKGSIDGVYGDLTLAAVKRFQSAKGLHADGIAGTRTIAKLNDSGIKKVSSGMLLAVGSTGTEVKHLQQYLDSKGYLNTDDAGTFGTSTAEALKQWQSANGKSATGTFTEGEYNRYIVD